MDSKDEATIALHNSLYQGACDLLLPYLEFGEGKDASSEKARSSVRRGCEMLERVISINPENWNAMWVMGMGWKTIKEHELAYDAFKRAFTIQKENVDVARELAGMCIALGKGKEAIRVARHALSLLPNDAGLVANYGLALLINGQLDEAAEAVNHSFRIDPLDPITLRLKNLVREIRAGRIPKPSKWPPS